MSQSFTKDHKSVDCQTAPVPLKVLTDGWTKIPLHVSGFHYESFFSSWTTDLKVDWSPFLFNLHLQIDFPSICRLAKSDGSCPSTVTDKVDGLPAAAPAALRAATKAMTSAWWGSIANRRCIDKWLCCSLTVVMMRTVVMLTILIVLTRLGEE